MFTAQADLVAHEFIAELEGIQPVATDGAVAQPDHHAAQDRFQLVLKFVKGVQRFGVFHALADIENGGCELAGLLRRDPGDLGVDGGKDRADDAERGERNIHQVAVALDKGLDLVVDVFGSARMRHDKGVLVGRGWLDLGGEAVGERELGLVLVDDPRQIAHGRGRELGLGDQ